MAFSIYIRNDGDTATVEVFQRINDNEPSTIFAKVLEAGVTEEATAYATEEDGNEGGEFIWRHHGSNLQDQLYVKAGEVMIVR